MGHNACLWPAPFNEDTLESAMAFVWELRTDNEAEKEVQHFPKGLDYFERLGFEWFKAKAEGSVVHILKARRMVVSWFFRGLELHQMGLKREQSVLAGEKYLQGARHVWRYEFLYEDLQRTHLSWKLPDHKHLQFQGDKALSRFSLPNGSSCTAINGEGSNIQGDGYARVTFEEFSLYPHAQTMLGQAKIVTQGSPTHKGGFIVTIANPEISFQYNQIIAGE